MNETHKYYYLRTAYYFGWPIITFQVTETQYV